MKVRFAVLLIFTTLVALPLKAQLTSEFTALHNLEKQKWEKAKGQLMKVLRKDSLNAAAQYGLAVYYFSVDNPAYQIDSAYHRVSIALLKYHHTPHRQRDRWRKIPLDSVVLITYRERIDSAAFNRAVHINTESGYIDFLTRFTTASQQALALELRDEVAYIDALRENTYQSFLKYLNKYPSAVRAPEAKARYEKLLFEARTKDKKLSSYEAFLIENPSTPYRKIIEQQIFEIITSSGRVRDFEEFLLRYPESTKVQMARNILYHILEDVEIPNEKVVNDSIRKIQLLEKSYLVPFLKDGKFGFMNENGVDVLKPEFQEIDAFYRCGNIMEQILILENKIMARNGSVIYEGEIEEVEDFGYGFLKIISTTCVKVIHYSGFSIGGNDCFEDAFLLRRNYVALQKGKHWSVWTLTGRMLVPFEWEEIKNIDNVLVFALGGKYKLTTIEDVAKAADQLPVRFTYSNLDEVKNWPDGKVWVRLGNRQAVLNQDLSEWIPLGAQEVTSTFFGAVSKYDSTGYILYQKSGLSQTFHRIKISNPWVAGKSSTGWQLWGPGIENPRLDFDSIGFVGPIVVAFKNDSMRVRMSSTSFIESVAAKPQFLAGKDSVFYLLLEEGEKKKLYNDKGELLFIVHYDHIEYNNEGFFTIHKKGKRGLVAADGKLIVQPDYDAMGPVKGGIVTVLKDRKFGLINLNTRQQIKTEYEKNVLPYNLTYLIAFKNGLYALLRWDNKPVTPFEFEEIRYWNDSSAIVKKNFNWIIYNFIEKKIVMDKIKKFKWVLDSEQEKIMIFQQENSYGVMSNKRGTIIAPTFSDILNLGSASVPLYFTEKHVEEAGIYVVIYYDKDGHQLRRQVFEVDDYERIYCTKNNN